MNARNFAVPPLANALFDVRASKHRAPARCFCFPYAGGSHTVFADWTRQLAPDVDVIPVMLPGRSIRFGAEPYCDFRSLMDDLERAIVPLLDREFMFFGHSLGALIVYELALRLQERQARRPLHVFLSGTRSPHSLKPASARLRPDDYKLEDAVLARKLADLGGIPRECLADQELLSVLLPTVRADFQIYHSYSRTRPAPYRVLSCPVTAFGGDRDVDEVPEQALRDWSRYTTASFDLRMFPGDHFFVHSQAESIVEHVRNAAGR